MKQYERKYPCFVFIGPSPIDYDHHKLYNECVWEELCNFNLRRHINNGKSKIGIVFNTDPHYKSGSHWISLFIDIKRGLIYFFDSTGDKPPKQVLKLVNTIKRQGMNQNIQFNYESNAPNVHQKKDTECGVYSIFFIVQMIKHGNYEIFSKGTISDSEIHEFRKVYFNY